MMKVSTPYIKGFTAEIVEPMTSENSSAYGVGVGDAADSEDNRMVLTLRRKSGHMLAAILSEAEVERLAGLMADIIEGWNARAYRDVAPAGGETVQ